jgi:CubicO group peptidase (beta-lactamase class C family)
VSRRPPIRRPWAALLAATIVAAASPGAGRAADDPLVGLWRYRTVAEPALRGALTLTRQGDAWIATISGRQASARGDGHALRLVFPLGLGEFRGRLATDGRTIEGFWLQPARPPSISGEPGGPSQPFSTPVILSAAGADAWRGKVRPVAGSFTLWLKLFRDADGALVAAFRNPEQNSNGGRTQFLASRDGETVRFSSRPQPGRSAVTLTAQLAGRRLRMTWPDLQRTIELSPVTGAEAQAFYPRPPGTRPYAYRAPSQLDDGWRAAAAASVGLDEAALARIVQAQAASDPTAQRPSLIHSILIARHGKLVLEEYFFGQDRATPHDLRSAAKSFNAVMLGAVMLRDPSLGPDSRISDLMAGLGPFAHPDPRKAQITLAHLMTHTSGLACDDNDDASPGNEDRMQRQTAQPNWWKYTLDLPMAHDPGARYAYCSANSNLVGGAITVRSGMWLPAYFDRTVARPLQFGPYAWNLTPTGDGYAGGGARLTSRDFLKVGQAWLDGGVWQGRRIAGADWVKLSTAPHADITPATTGLSEDAFADAYIRAQDGYGWHLNRLKVGEQTFQDYEATGNGGQLLIVVPEADLAVAITAGNYGQGGIWLRWRDTIVGQQILANLR